MVHARWAVACLLSVVLFAGLIAEGDAADNASITSPSAQADNTVNAPPLLQADNTVYAPPPRAISQGGPEYRLGPEDVLRISVWENKELTLDLAVRPDGKISMPLIQDVTAEGQTPVELANTIQQRLLDFINDPQVSVIVLQVNAPKYFIIGNVAKPGVYSLRSETSVLQALALAGGFTQFASRRSIKLIRNHTGKQEIRKINFNNVIEESGEGNFVLKSGDTIVVP